MTHEFEKEYWDAHWAGADDQARIPPHPALAELLTELPPGTALDAGSGAGAEASWLAARGWDVTAVDIAARALGHAAARSLGDPGRGSVTWVEADLTVWQPERPFDLVATFYAHPAMPQDAFYARIARWVAPGGALLIVGHDHGGEGDGPRSGHRHRSHSGHGGHSAHPANAVTGPGRIRALLDPALWVVRIAEVRERIAVTPGGGRAALRDVVVQARRT
jgi:SAM-dependent methyltransferase